MTLIFNSETEICQVFDAEGALWRRFAMSDAAVAGPGFGHHGRCPRGTYELGHPVRVHDPSMGDWFTPLLLVPGREGIGIHGGGSSLVRPFAPQQHLLPTYGCLRVHNFDNELLAAELIRRFAAREKATIRVEGP